MAGIRRAATAFAVLLLIAAWPAHGQELLQPGVYVQEVSARTAGGETATGQIHVVRAADARTALAPDTRRTLVNRAAIEVPAGELQRLLERASRDGSPVELRVRGRATDGQYYTVTMRDVLVSSYQTGGRGPASATLTSRGTPLPVVTCNPAICTGPNDSFLFMYDCITNGHTYVPGAGGDPAVCRLDNP